MFKALMSMFSTPDVETERIVGYRSNVYWASSNLPEPNFKYVAVRVMDWEDNGPTVLIIEVVQKAFKVHYKFYDAFPAYEIVHGSFRNYTERGGIEEPDFDEEVEA